MSEVRESKITSSQLIPLMLLTAILSFIGTVVIALNGSVGGTFMCRYAWGTVSKTMGIPIMSLLVILFAFPLKFFGRRLSTSMLISLYIVGATVGMYGIGHYETFASFPVGFSRTVLFTPSDFKTVVEGWWWVPPYDVVLLITTGGANVDWGAWAGSIVFWSLYLLIFYLFGSSLMLLFRRRWLDIEKVQFPYVIASHDIIERASGEPSIKGGVSGGRTWRWFIIGFMIALIYELQVTMTSVFMWWPDILAWRGTAIEETSAQGCVCLHSNHPIASMLVWFPGYSKNILPFFIYYLAPMDVLFTVWVWEVVMMVLAQIAYTQGYYTGIFQNGSACRVRGWGGFETSPLYGPPFYWVWMTMIGGTTAIAVMMMFHARSYMAETVRLALRRGGGKAAEEEGEPFTYRMIYMLIIVSAILVLLFCFSAGMSLGSALSVLIVGAFTDTLAAAYVLGLSGSTYIHNRGYWPSWPLRFIWFDARPETYTTDWVMSHTILGTGVNHVTMGLQTGAYLTIQNIKIGGIGKINLRDVFLLTTAASVIAIFVANVTRVWIVNLLGVGRVPIWGECSITDWCDNDFNDFDRAPSSPFLLSAGGAGFLITMVLSLLRAKFLWWPLHPVGFVIATSIAPNHMKEWTTFMIAWVVKWLTLKVGGSKAYGEIGVPLMSGGVAGYALSNLIAYLIGTVKFFVPF